MKNNTTMQHDSFKWVTEQFEDLRILRFQVPEFDSLNREQKIFAYYLSEAAYWGREIYYDQNYKHNLCLKRTFESILENTDPALTDINYIHFLHYVKSLWVSNGIHHFYSTDKLEPHFSEQFFERRLLACPKESLPLQAGETPQMLLDKLKPIIFDPKVAAKKVNLSADEDLIQTSAVNFYEGLTQKEVEDFYNKKRDAKDHTPPSWGLNSKLVKSDKGIEEKVWKLDGMYGKAIGKIIENLEAALPYCENEQQKTWLKELISFYQTGDLKTFDQYSISWTKTTEGIIDAVNGYIEVYNDPLGMRGAWQSLVSMKDMTTTKQFSTLSSNAGWFEQHSSIAKEFKRENPQGVSYKVIATIAGAGDVSPVSPIGVNLPNADWIRSTHGSKSVSLGNIENAYDEALKSTGLVDEFYRKEDAELVKRCGSLGGKLHTGLHEVIGHGSGKLLPGINTDTLKNYASTLEEARADLVALYFMLDPYMVTIGLMPSLDYGKSEYISYLTNGLISQLRRIKPGNKLEEAHMRNRQLIAQWCFEHGKAENVVELKKVDGKTYVFINDYNKLKTLFGDLLREIQRVKSEGDYHAGKNLVEQYGVQVDQALHKEVLERSAKLNVAPFAGFINPLLTPVMHDGKIVNVEISYPDDFMQQMLYYAKHYSILPTYND